MTETAPNYAEVLSAHKNKTIREMWEMVVNEAKPLAEIQDKVRAASPPPVSELDKQLSESDDPEVQEFRAEIERLEAALRTAREDAHKHLLKGYNTIPDAEMAELQQSYGKQMNVVRKSVGLLRDYAAMFMKDEDLVKVIDQYRIPNLRGGTTTGRTNIGDGGPRPRVGSVTVTRADGQSKTDSRISVVAPWAKLSPADIYAAWLKAAGTTQWQDISETHEFQVGDCTVVIVPKSPNSEE